MLWLDCWCVVFFGMFGLAYVIRVSQFDSDTPQSERWFPMVMFLASIAMMTDGLYRILTR